MGDDTATHVWLVLHKTARAVERNALASISQLGLGLSDFAVLELLLHKGPQPVNRIGRKVLLSSGSITAAVDRLQDRTLVERIPDQTDGRTRIVQLTDAGKTLIRQAFDQHQLDMEETMAVLRPRERTEVVTLLRKLGLFAEARADAGYSGAAPTRTVRQPRRRT